MNRFVLCLAAALAGTAPLLPAVGQELAAGLAMSPVVIAPPATPLAATIKAGLSSAYYGAARDSAAYREGQDLYFFYGARHFEPIWLDEGPDGQVAFSGNAQRIMRLFGDAASLGLDPSDYLTPDLELASAGSDPASLAALETGFSAAVMRYATHLYTGRIDPRTVDEMLDIVPKRLDESALLMELASSEQPEAVLAALEPTHPQYLALKAVLAKHGRDDEDTWTSITVSKGSVQHLDFLTEQEKAVFKTAFELDQRWVVEHAADRTPYICQSQSVNLFLPADVHKRDLHQIHYQAWKKGVKSLYYCRSLSIQRADAISEKVAVQPELGFAAATSVDAVLPVPPAPRVRAVAAAEGDNGTNYEECLACQ